MKVGFFLGFVPFAPVLPQIFLLIMLEVRVLGWLNVIWDEGAAEEILRQAWRAAHGSPIQLPRPVPASSSVQAAKFPFLLALSFDLLAVWPSSMSPKDGQLQGCPELPQGHCWIPGPGMTFG